MNWFQIVFLREDSQVKRISELRSQGCELISNCIFTWGFTSANKRNCVSCRLWIDFKLYFYVRIHKRETLYSDISPVVNWFQIVFLREDSQADSGTLRSSFCCELISNCIFTWGFTRRWGCSGKSITLWIDFKLYFYVRIHKAIVEIKKVALVVNWFQIVFLREDSQADSVKSVTQPSCELISNCIFTWGFTSRLFCIWKSR